jgi:enoyl-CoA hydratase
VLLQPDEVAAAVASRELSVLRDRPFVAVDLRDGDGGVDLAGLARLPVVVIGFGGDDDACDVLASDAEQLGALTTAIRRDPQASVTLVQLLRMVPHLDPLDALVAESMAYAALQGGAEFRAWLAGRGERVRRPEVEEPVLVSRRDDSLRIELNRPRLLNLYNAAMRDALAEALTLATVDDSVRLVELCGRGKAFCAGGDPAEFGMVSDPATAHLIRSTANAAPLLVALQDRLVVRVHGAAVGAGCELAAFAGRVVATGDAQFRLPEVAMGLVPGAGGTVSVTRRIGRHRAAWMMLTGETVDAPTALAWGLADEVERTD